MSEIPQPLGGTFCACAAECHTILIPHYGSAADGTLGGDFIGYGIGRTLVHHHFHNFGDNLTRLADDDRVADANILAGDEILIMKGGKGHGAACQADRFKHRLRCQYARAPHLDHNIFQHRRLLLRRVLVGYRPAGTLGGAAQHIALGEVVQLHHRAVNVKGIVAPLFPKAVDLFQHFLRRMEAALRDHLEVLGLQILDGFRMAGKGFPFAQLHVENGNIQLALGGNTGIQLAERPCGGVTGIGHQGLTLNFAAGIDLLKNAAGHIDLAADDEAGQLFRQRHRQRADGAEILRHILAHAAITTGSTAIEHAIAVLHRHAEAIHLGLDTVGGMGDLLCHAVKKGPHFLSVKHVLQALQGHIVAHLLELAQNLTANALGGRIGSHFLGMLSLQLLQTAQQAVIFKIGHSGGIQHVVEMSCLVQRFTQLGNFLSIVHSRFLLHH